MKEIEVPDRLANMDGPTLVPTRPLSGPPLERLRELADDGEIGSVTRGHYAFTGATDPESCIPPLCNSRRCWNAMTAK